MNDELIVRPMCSVSRMHTILENKKSYMSQLEESIGLLDSLFHHKLDERLHRSLRKRIHTINLLFDEAMFKMSIKCKEICNQDITDIEDMTQLLALNAELESEIDERHLFLDVVFQLIEEVVAKGTTWEQDMSDIVDFLRNRNFLRSIYLIRKKNCKYICPELRNKVLK